MGCDLLLLVKRQANVATLACRADITQLVPDLLLGAFCLHKFNGLLACQVFYCHLQHTQRPPFPVNSRLTMIGDIIGRIFQSQFFNGIPLSLLVFDDTDGSKNNYTSEIRRIFFWNDLVFVNDAK